MYTLEYGVSVEYFNNYPEARDAAVAAFHTTGNTADVYLNNNLFPTLSIHEGNTIRHAQHTLKAQS